MKPPCCDCLILSVCNINHEKILECDIFKSFINKNIFEDATKMVQDAPDRVGFYLYACDHPTDKLNLLGVSVLIHSDKIYLKGIQKIRRI